MSHLELQIPSLYLSFEELCLSTNLRSEYLLRLVECDVVSPVLGSFPDQWQFHVADVAQVKKATRLNRDLDIDWSDLVLILNLMNQVDSLKSEKLLLQQQLDRFL